MAIDTERETESEAPADGGLCRLDRPASEPEDDAPEDELDGS